MQDTAPVYLSKTLRTLFAESWAASRVIFFSAPCGCGKTAAAQALLAGRSVCRLTAAGVEAGLTLPPRCEAVLLDELPSLRDPAAQNALCAAIRAHSEMHFVLLSRGPLPGWLMPFEFSGMLSVIGQKDLLLDRAAMQQMLEEAGAPPEALAAAERDFKGYAITLRMLCRRLAQGKAYTGEVYTAVKRELFVYYDDAVFRRFSLPMRQMLLYASILDGFDMELAKMVSGDPHAGERMGELLRDTTMLESDGLDSYHFQPIFLEFLRWETKRKLTAEEQREACSRAALYYELHEDAAHALDFYARAGEQHKLSEILIKNANLHPGVGHYYELEKYYYALPRTEVLRSPALMCAMSMLTSMCLDYETSEMWYQELQHYAAGLRRTDSEYKEVQGRLAYLDIALPQRGSRGLIEVIANVFRVMSDRQLSVPSFSVTSTLPSIMNGGKDFCEWSKKDELLYATMRRPVEAVLGRDGVGLADCSICESKFEKGEDISERMLALLGRLSEIQARGTPDIEFAVVGLLARLQVSKGRADAALDSLKSLRAKYAENGEVRFLPNIDAALCRVHLRLEQDEEAEAWLRESAPKDAVRLRALWRYRYFTQAMVQIRRGEYSEALIVLVRLLPYCEHCGRVMDSIYIRLLMAICHYRKGESSWENALDSALDSCREYRFVWPVAQYGAAILPLLQACRWTKDEAYLHALTAAARAQAVYYPGFLKCERAPVQPLSAAEMQVLRLLCHNMSNSEIGEVLDIRLPTVKTHVSHILQKLGVARRSEAKEAAQKLHLV